MFDILRLCPLFEGLTDAQIQDTLSFYQSIGKSYSKGEFLLRAGERVSRFGIVISGVVQIMMDDFDGRQMIMATVEKGQTFAESLCYQGAKESPVYACAVENVSVLWLSAQGLTGQMGGGHCMHCRRFIRMLTLKTLSMNDRIQVLSKQTLREKLMTLFTQYSTRDGRVFTLPFDRSSMATYLGVNRSALSRELSLMKKEGKIDFYKNSFTILSAVKEAEYEN
ncbi:MAG: Crp/Fnr family transcriptional regulator [Clostridia bacterium]|nr:Crp/Fnr family transcriptional regulator [Clostridia bacterium]